MELAIYAKKRTMTNGKTFYSYLATLPRKDGTDQTVTVRFRDEAGSPDPAKCPMNIIVDKKDSNVSKRTYTTADGEIGTAYTLWVSAWEVGAPYIDTSLDEFDV